MSILDQIDRVTSGLCPCGAEPAEGSAYCSDDCRPTHISRDTDTRDTGHYATPMRWRPDLVTAADDSGLTSLGGRVRSGRYWRELFERDTDTLHLRVDDGHRYAGADVAVSAGHDQCNVVWTRLERELGDPRRAVPTGGPVAAGWRLTEATRTRICDWLRANNLNPDRMPEDARIVVTDTEIEAEECATDADGNIVLDGPDPRRITRRVPLIEPWPEDLFYAFGVDRTSRTRLCDTSAVAVAPVGTSPNDPDGWTGLGAYITDDGLTPDETPWPFMPMGRDEAMAGLRAACERVRARNRVG